MIPPCVECPVCYEFKPCETTICDHEICHECLQIWYYYSDQCPICRSTLSYTDNGFTQKIARHRYRHRHLDPSLENDKGLEIIIYNETNVEIMSVVYNAFHWMSESYFLQPSDPDDVIYELNNRCHGIPTTQCVEDNRVVFFVFYLDGHPSSKWYLNDFSPHIKERLMLKTNTNMILNELEIIFDEFLNTCLN